MRDRGLQSKRIEPTPVAPKTESLLSRRFVHLNRNFLNYPIARDSRCKMRWRRLKKNGDWFCEPPGTENISLRFSDTDASLKRCPTAFDVNVLLLLLSESQIQNSQRLEFSSSAAILKKLGFSVEARNRKRLIDSLKFWSAIRLHCRDWYVSKQGKETKTFPSPVTSFEPLPRGLRIEIAQPWFAMKDDGYFASVPWPLPREAASQNLALWTRTAILQHYGEGNWRCTHRFRLKAFCQKIGCAHSTRNRALPGIIKAAMEWYKNAGGELSYINDEGLIAFILKHPKLPKAQKAQKKKAVEKPLNSNAAEDAGSVEKPEISKANNRRKTRRVKVHQKPRMGGRQGPPQRRFVDAIDESGRHCQIEVDANGNAIELPENMDD